MSFLKNLKIGVRLGIGFSILILLSILGTLMGVRGVVDVREDARTLGQRQAELMLHTQGWRRGIESNIARTWVVFFAQDPTVRERVKEEMRNTSDELTIRIERIRAMAQDPRALQMLDEITRRREAYSKLRANLMQRHEAGEDVSQEVIAKVFPASASYLGGVAELADLQQKRSEETLQEAETSATEALTVLTVSSAVAVLIGILLSLMLTRSVVAPLRRAQHTAAAIAQGDLTTEIAAEGKDEVGQLTEAMRRMQASLRDIVSSVRRSSDSIATGSQQIATGNADLSQRTEEQASNLQQTAASMQQLGSTVRNNSETAREASEFAATASEVASRGGEVVGQVVATMEEISSSSRKISDIISVIDGIAFQTNILALNAAVEAARAGEQGRGFAVVATEVRNLAQRSADAAKQIKDLINDSVQKVEMGSTQVDHAGRTMTDIVEQVSRVSELIASISAATQEQTQGIGQVGDAVTQLDQVTQQNAALVEESAAAAESLRQQAAQLVEAVSVFRLGREDAGFASRAAPAPAPVATVTTVAPASKAARPSRSPAPAPATAETADTWETF